MCVCTGRDVCDMKIITKWKTLFCLMSCIFSLLMATPVLAAEVSEQTVQAYIPVTCVGENTTESFVYHLKADSTQYQTFASDTLSLKDGEDGTFVVTYTSQGVYSYSVYQDVGSDENTVYDDISYQVFVYVSMDEKGKLIADTVAYANSSDEKAMSLDFKNVKTEKMDDNTDDNSNHELSDEDDGNDNDSNKDESNKDSKKYGNDSFADSVQTSDMDMSLAKMLLLLSGVLLIGGVGFLLRFRSTKQNKNNKA